MPPEILSLEAGNQSITDKELKERKRACHGCGKRGHATQECFAKREMERKEGGIPQIPVFDKTNERTPRRGLGQPKGKGPLEPQDRRGRVGFYDPPTIRVCRPSERKEYKQSEKVEDNRPPGRKLETWREGEEYGTGTMTVPKAESENRERYVIYLTKVKARPTGPSKFWKDQMRTFVTREVEKVFPNSQATIKGISWYYSHPWN